MAVDPSTSTRLVRRRRRRPAGRAIHYLLLLATCALVANALVGESGLLATRMASNQHSRLAQQIVAVERENDTLREQVRRLREDPTFIEEVARREFGLIRPGERVFVIRPVPGDTDTVVPDTEP